MAIVDTPPRRDIEIAGCVLNVDVDAWNAALLLDESISDEENMRCLVIV
jgi:hypothetical protein